MDIGHQIKRQGVTYWVAFRFLIEAVAAKQDSSPLLNLILILKVLQLLILNLSYYLHQPGAIEHFGLLKRGLREHLALPTLINWLRQSLKLD